MGYKIIINDEKCYVVDENISFRELGKIIKNDYGIEADSCVFVFEDGMKMDDDDEKALICEHQFQQNEAMTVVFKSGDNCKIRVKASTLNE